MVRPEATDVDGIGAFLMAAHATVGDEPAIRLVGDNTAAARLPSGMKEREGNVLVLDANLAGIPTDLRAILNPPRGFELEYRRGGMAGDTHSYVPMGDETKVVEVEFFLKRKGENEIRQPFLSHFERIFSEDNANPRSASSRHSRQSVSVIGSDKEA